LLIDEAARRLNLPTDDLKAENGAVIAPDGRSLAYGALVGETVQHVRAQPVSKRRDPATFKVLNTPLHRVDIPAKVTGGAAYVQDMRLPGMLHARVVRPPSYGAQLRSGDIDGAAKAPGVVKVIRDGNFLAVVATREFQAIKAMRVLAASAEWDETAKLPIHDNLADVLVALPSRDLKLLDNHEAAGPAVRTRQAIRVPISRVARSGLPAQWRSSWTASFPSGPIPRASIQTGPRLPRCCGCRRTRCAASMWKVRAATAITAPTMRLGTRL
jgi:nicotinate dehydrogenase subunit B